MNEPCTYHAPWPWYKERPDFIDGIWAERCAHLGEYYVLYLHVAREPDGNDVYLIDFVHQPTGSRSTVEGHTAWGRDEAELFWNWLNERMLAGEEPDPDRMRYPKLLLPPELQREL